MTEQELKKEIKQGNFRRFYFIYGEDNYLKNHYARLIAEKSADILPDMNLKKIDGTRTDINTIYNETEQLPCMAEHRCVLLNDYDYASAADSEQKRFIEIVSDLPESTVLVMLADAIEISQKYSGKWQPLIRAANKYGAALNFEHMSVPQLSNILIKAAAKRKVMLDTSTAKYMIECCGRELAKLQGEIEKLCSFAGEGGRITCSDIDRQCAKTADANKYQLTRYIFSGDLPTVLQMISDLFDMQMKPIEVYSLILGGFVDLYRAKMMSAAHISPAQAAEDFGYGKRAFVLENSVRTANRISTKTLRKCLDMLNDGDIRLKSTSDDKRFIIEQTVICLVRELKADSI